MSFLILPRPITVTVKANYLYNLESNTDETVTGKILALEAYKNCEITVLVLLNNGATFHDLPLCSVRTTENSLDMSLPYSYCRALSAQAELTILPLPDVQIFNKQKIYVGPGKYLATIVWPEENLLLHLIDYLGRLILWPPHKLLFGKDAGTVLPDYKKWRHQNVDVSEL